MMRVRQTPASNAIFDCNFRFSETCNVELASSLGQDTVAVSILPMSAVFLVFGLCLLIALALTAVERVRRRS